MCKGLKGSKVGATKQNEQGADEDDEARSKFEEY